MQWIAPSEKDSANGTLEKRLWDAADQFRTNSGLKAQEYSSPVLGLIFLRFADVRFAAVRALLDAGGVSSRRASRVDDATAYHAEGVLFLSPEARFEHLLSLPEGADVGKAINDAMRDIEKHNPQLAGVLPKTYNLFTGTLLKELLKKVSEIPATVDYDAFGRIYEYFRANSPAPRARKAASSTPRPASSASSLKSSNRTTGASSIPHAARAAVCLPAGYAECASRQRIALSRMALCSRKNSSNPTAATAQPLGGTFAERKWHPLPTLAGGSAVFLKSRLRVYSLSDMLASGFPMGSRNGLRFRGALFPQPDR